MGKIKLLDCTLRDGGYVNDWRFTERGMNTFCEKIAKTGIEYCELGFMKGDAFDKDRAVFPSVESYKSILKDKNKDMIYLGMIDTGNLPSLDNIEKCDNKSVDGFRVIFKNSKIDVAIDVCKKLLKLGYIVIGNFVNTEVFSDDLIIDTIDKFNKLNVHALSIVDTFGDLSNAEFLRLVNIFDKHMNSDIALCYHAHNNLQQAFQNSQSFVELNLKRDIIIDGCVFGMGRGAGNLNLELFAKFLNDNYGKDYHIVPMLEIMDECLQDFYKENFWGYSLPLYISASLKVHPNYAIYLASKNTLSESSLYNILKGISDTDKVSYSKEVAERYYRKYQENLIDDKSDKEKLYRELCDKDIILLAPGNTLNTHKDIILKDISDNKSTVIALNFYSGIYKPKYVFSSNMRRYSKIDNDDRFKSILTSNMKEAKKIDYFINYTYLLNKEPEIDDNSGLMFIRFLVDIGIKKVKVAGMDGYNESNKNVYVDDTTFYDFSMEAEKRNRLIKKNLDELKKKIDIIFITPSIYNL